MNSYFPTAISCKHKDKNELAYGMQDCYKQNFILGFSPQRILHMHVNEQFKYLWQKPFPSKGLSKMSKLTVNWWLFIFLSQILLINEGCFPNTEKQCAQMTMLIDYINSQQTDFQLILKKALSLTKTTQLSCLPY